jgi:hypothetical protein
MKNTAILLVQCPDRKGLSRAIHNRLSNGSSHSLASKS